jgi:hypothetical protein
MNLPHFLPTVLFALALVPSAGRAQDLGETVSAPGVFSYQAPRGWTVKDSSMSKYDVCFDTPKDGFAANITKDGFAANITKDGFAANINVVRQAYPKPLADYVDLNKSQIKSIPLLQNVIIIDEKPFQTSGGLTGTRLVITDAVGKADLEQTFYFFAGAMDIKFVVTASCLIGDEQKYAPIFDASIKTFSLR